MKRLINEEATAKKADECGGGKRGYLSWLLYHDFQYEDLHNKETKNLACNDSRINDSSLTKVEIRKLFLLWEEVVKLFNKESRIKQLTEDFGLWLKQNSDLPAYDSYELEHPEGQETVKQLLDKFEQEIKAKFALFKEGVVAKDNKGILVQNPAYFVNDAWKGLWLSRDGRIKGGPRAPSIYQDWRVLGAVIESIKNTDFVIKPAQSRLALEVVNYNPQALLSDGIIACDQAVELDPTFFGIWAAYNARAILAIVQKAGGITHVKQRGKAIDAIRAFISDMQHAINAIQTLIIPQLEAQLTFSLQHGLECTSDNAKQQMLTIETYKLIIESLNNNIKVAIEAGNDEKGKLDIDRTLSLEEVTQNLNVTAITHKWMSVTKGRQVGSSLYSDTQAISNLAGLSVSSESRKMVIDQIEQYGGYLFKMHVARLKEEKKNWWGTFFSAVLGAVSIFAGIALMTILPGSGVFLTTFANSLVANGVSDLISSAISVFTGNPIDFGAYISAKGVSLAVSAAISGALYLIQKVAEYAKKFSELAKNIHEKLIKHTESLQGVAAKPEKWVFDTFKTNLAVRGISKVASTLGNKLLIDKDEIKNKARNAINGIIERCKHILERISATGKALLEALYAEISNIINNYRWQLSTGTQATLDTGTGVLDAFTDGKGKYINSATQALSGAIENEKVIREIARDVEATIKSKERQALTSNEIFEREFKIERNGKEGSGLARELKALNIELNREYDCKQLDVAPLSEVYSQYQASGLMVGVCTKVQSLLASSGDFAELRERFIHGVTEVKGNIQAGMIDTGANLVGSELAPSLVEAVDKTTDNILDYIKEKQANRDPHVKTSGTSIKEEVATPKYFGEAANDHAAYQVQPKPRVQSKQANKYTIKAGDTLSAIAYKLSKELGRKVSIDELLKLNPAIKNSNLIYAGAGINIPAKPTEGFRLTTKPQGLKLATEKLVDLDKAYAGLSVAGKKEVDNNARLIEGLRDKVAENLSAGDQGMLYGKLEYIAEKADYYLKQYQKYEVANPRLAKVMLLSGMVLAKGLVGATVAGVASGGAGVIPGFVGGLAKGTSDEFLGLGVNVLLGDNIGNFINQAIDKYSPNLIKLDSSLTPAHAAMLPSLLLAGALTSSEFISFAKSIRRVDFSKAKIINGKVGGQYYFSKQEFGSKASAATGTAEARILKAGTDAGGGFKHHIDVDESVLKRVINLPNDFNSPKLRAKFDAHKDVFGMKDVNFNKQNAELFKQKIVDHINNPETIPIAGQYNRGVGNVVHYYNPKTEVNVMKDMNGDFVSVWGLTDKQLDNLRISGKIGGGR